MKYNILLVISIFVLLAGCGNSNIPEIKQFEILTNVDHNQGDTIMMTMDLTDAIIDGIMIPSLTQTKNGYFNFSFNIKKCGQPMYYKIYYQNESYKYEEWESNKDGENFYGSWANVNKTFKSINISALCDYVTITDSFRIVGNPRSESIYNGISTDKHEVHEDDIMKRVESMKENTAWYKSIAKKAKEEKRDIELQLYLDALWVINYNRQKGDVNNRWKRNPRTGIYKFLLVVATEEALKKIPYEVKNISKTDTSDKFVNPIGYFLHGLDSTLQQQGVAVTLANTWLKLDAKLSPGAGIYVDLIKASNPNLDKSYYNDQCNESWEIYKKAHFAQYFHVINKDYVMKNIPVIADVINDSYSKETYLANKKKYTEKDLITDYPTNSDCPCKTVISDSQTNTIELRNPGNNNIKTATKQHVGIIGRIGFTYGKHTARIDFPKQLNNTNVWNGITNAFWMIYQDESSWNQRHICHDEGYIPKDKTEKDSTRVPVLNYSEIDFEIVKASKYWTYSSYPKDRPYPREDASLNNQIIVACTNWDLACRNPKQYSWGVFDVPYQDTNYVFHRWDQYYKAVSTKVPVPEDMITKYDYYYYQIDWQPDRITWRIGPEKDQLETIASIDNNYTSIANNQMVVVVTQEYHYADWWPTTPFEQDYIPYPKNDIVGKVSEITIE